MDYRGIRYTIRSRVERGEWSVAIYPSDVESPGKVITGEREQAEALARSMIQTEFMSQQLNSFTEQTKTIAEIFTKAVLDTAKS